MKKGFSIAEALITLMIVSLILAAVLPVVSKKSKTNDAIWHYVTNGTGANSDIYYGNSNSQTTILGNTSAPDASRGSRLVIVTPEDNSGDTIRRSLIDFYQRNSTGLTNIGRITFDNRTNVAIGPSSLSLNTSGNSNTAIGSNSLRNNNTGGSNTSIGAAAMQENLTGSANTAMGINSLRDNQSGDSNTAIGQDSMNRNLEGDSNTAIGRAALFSNTIGNQNTAIGIFALATCNGGGNTAVGAFALRDLMANSNNTAIGFQAGLGAGGQSNTAIGSFTLQATSNGSQNTAVGDFALNQNTSSQNTAVGAAALQQNTSGTLNVAVGFQALQLNESGIENTGVGDGALSRNTLGIRNTATGSSTLANNTIGNGNTASGDAALVNNTKGIDNTAFGRGSLFSNIIGNRNTALGADSCNLTNGDNNICIGFEAGPGSTTNNQLFIDISRRNDALIWGDFAARTIKINGTLTVNGFTNLSDKRIKNVEKENKVGLEKILKLKVFDYTFKDTINDNRKHTGILAQDLQKVIPNAVIQGPGNDNHKTLLYVDSSEILFSCVNAIKQLHHKIVNINNKIAKLNEQINKLQKENSELKQKNAEFEVKINILANKLEKLEHRK